MPQTSGTRVAPALVRRWSDERKRAKKRISGCVGGRKRERMIVSGQALCGANSRSGRYSVKNGGKMSEESM